MLLFAQHAMASWSVTQWLIAILVIGGMVAVVMIVTRANNIPIPGWVFQVLWVILAVIIGVVAIRFLATML